MSMIPFDQREGTIWFDGVMVPWRDAKIHVLSHGLHYGSSVFEGLRAYETPNGTAIFRLGDHTRRLFQSAKIYDIQIPYTQDEINAACREIVKVNGLGKAYLRPVAFRGYGGIGIRLGFSCEFGGACCLKSGGL